MFLFPIPVSGAEPLKTRIGRIDRLSLRFGAVFALVVALACLGIYLSARTAINHRLESSLMSDKTKLVGNGPLPNHQEVARRIAGLEARHPASSRGHVLFDPAGRLVVGHARMAEPRAGLSDIAYSDIGVDHIRNARALGTDLPDGYRLVVFGHSEFAQNLNKMLLPTLVALLVVCAGGGIMVTVLLGREIARRLGRTIQAADAIAAGDLARRVPLERLDGVFLLQAESFNRMLNRMEDLIRNQRQFSGNLAHDLRTPLTRLRGLLAKGHTAAESGERPRIMAEAERECASIIAIFESLLRLSEIEAGLHPAALQPIALRPLIEDVVETMEPVLADQGSTLMIEHIDDAWVIADSGLLSQMLVNMLENVALHTPPGTNAQISLREEAEIGCVLISLRDNGPGLAPDDRSRVTSPFVRGSSSGQVRGSGLGLAIVQAIVSFHKGHLQLSDNQPGLRADISLPRAAA